MTDDHPRAKGKLSVDSRASIFRPNSYVFSRGYFIYSLKGFLSQVRDAGKRNAKDESGLVNITSAGSDTEASFDIMGDQFRAPLKTLDTIVL